MRITLSERRFTERIRQLENIPAEVTTDEITHRLDQYAKRLFEHLRSYGINQVGLVSMNGTLGEFFVGLDACWDDASRNTRLQGLAMLDPLSVTLEERDLPAFFTRGVLLTAMSDAFDSYAHEVQRLTVSELDAALQRIAERVAFAPKPAPFVIENESDAATAQEIADQEFEMFCLRSGLKVPGAERRAREAAEAEATAKFQAAQKAASEKWWADHSNED